ncbi:MAG: helix-turn-helix transcriptional regulator [Parcubacteria group bacterium]|nr:helix-turn-helix transcriptional regulator [Parcubacteria group bacterium]
MENVQVALGKKIKETRKLKEYTQEELAEMVELSPNFIGYLERGKTGAFT